MIEQIVLIVHVLAAIAIVAFILLQQGKGADMGASFGSGSSQTVFGAQGGGNLLTRWTAILVAIFLATSLSLAYFAHKKSEGIYDVIIDQEAVESSFILPTKEGEVANPVVDQQSDVPTIDAPKKSEGVVEDADIPSSN